MKSLLLVRVNSHNARPVALNTSRNYSPLPLRFRGTPDTTFLDLKIPLAVVLPPARPIAQVPVVVVESD